MEINNDILTFHNHANNGGRFDHVTIPARPLRMHAHLLRSTLTYGIHILNFVVVYTRFSLKVYI